MPFGDPAQLLGSQITVLYANVRWIKLASTNGPYVLEDRLLVSAPSARSPINRTTKRDSDATYRSAKTTEGWIRFDAGICQWLKA